MYVCYNMEPFAINFIVNVRNSIDRLAIPKYAHYSNYVAN